MRNFLKMVPMFVIMGTIFFLSHQPGDTLHLPRFIGADKIAHCAIYTLLGLTVIFAHDQENCLKAPLRVSITAILVTLCYGILDEFHQSFIPGRYPSLGDIIADTIGGLVAVIFFIYFRKRARKL